MKRVVGILLLIGAHAFANVENLITTDLYIKDRRQAIDLKVANSSAKEIYCDTVNVGISLVGDEFGESLGEVSLSQGPFYFLPHQEFVLETLGSEQVSQARSENTIAIISRAKVTSKSCKEVGFVEYCKYAQKSSEELYTLDRLMNAAKTARCEDIELNLAGKLRLDEERITNLKPISYLTSLKRISLKENKLEDLGALKTLVQLQEIDISKNPVKEIDTLLQLPNIRAIDASHTLVYYRGVDYNQYSLRKVYLRGTPYESQKPR